MALDPQQELHLVDAQGNPLGSVSIDRIEGDQVFARFCAAAGFARVQLNFREFEEAVNDQLFHEADRLSREIDSLGLRLASVDGTNSLQLEDVQIMNDTDLSCRVPNLGLTQSKQEATHAMVRTPPTTRRSNLVAQEMLNGLQAFARDLKDLPGDDVKAKYRHRTVKVDLQPRDYEAQDVKQLRSAMQCSQKVFSEFIGVSLGTLRNWEQGARPVSGVAARMFDEMRINPAYWKIRLQQSLKERKAG